MEIKKYELFFFFFPSPCESYRHKFRRRGADLGYCPARATPLALQTPQQAAAHPALRSPHLPTAISSHPAAPARLISSAAGRDVPSQPFRVTSAKGLSQRLHCRPMTPGLQGHCPVSMSQERVWEPEGKQSQG